MKDPLKRQQHWPKHLLELEEVSDMRKIEWLLPIVVFICTALLVWIVLTATKGYTKEQRKWRNVAMTQITRQTHIDCLELQAQNEDITMEDCLEQTTIFYDGE